MSLHIDHELVVLKREGLYCPPGGFFIDPWRPVERAVITHAHADHARVGHAHYLASTPSAGVLRRRLGDIRLQTLHYGEALRIGDVTVSLHPAGHVLGSAQVRIEHAGRVWVASGDFHLSAHDEANATCAPFEPVRCHCFITESTFGLPIYRWAPEAEVFAQINAWWRGNAEAGRTSLLMGYSFGKAQRLLAGVDAGIGPIVVHGAVAAINEAYRDEGVALPATVEPATLGLGDAKRALIVAPPSVQSSPWLKRFGEGSDAFASGWMALRGTRRRQGLDRGFALSDHADWPGLQRAIAATGAERVIVTHGYEATLVRWLREQGLQADAFVTEYGDEQLDAATEAAGDTA
jgi:putative mRNA 3-end processing factor